MPPTACPLGSQSPRLPTIPNPTYISPRFTPGSVTSELSLSTGSSPKVPARQQLSPLSFLPYLLPSLEKLTGCCLVMAKACCSLHLLCPLPPQLTKISLSFQLLGIPVLLLPGSLCWLLWPNIPCSLVRAALPAASAQATMPPHPCPCLSKCRENKRRILSDLGPHSIVDPSQRKALCLPHPRCSIIIFRLNKRENTQ